MAKNPTHYVDNDELREELIKFKQECIHNREQGLNPPKPSDKLGSMLLLIASRLAYRANFINYTYRDEMVGDALENMILYLDRYDPEKSSNAFAYLSQICFFAFVRRIQKEKKQTIIKASIVQSQSVDDLLNGLGDVDEDISGPIEKVLEYYYNFEIPQTEKEKSKQEKKKDKTIIEELMEGGDKDATV